MTPTLTSSPSGGWLWPSFREQPDKPILYEAKEMNTDQEDNFNRGVDFQGGGFIGTYVCT